MGCGRNWPISGVRPRPAGCMRCDRLMYRRAMDVVDHVPSIFDCSDQRCHVNGDWHEDHTQRSILSGPLVIGERSPKLHRIMPL